MLLIWLKRVVNNSSLANSPILRDFLEEAPRTFEQNASIAMKKHSKGFMFNLRKMTKKVEPSADMIELSQHLKQLRASLIDTYNKCKNYMNAKAAWYAEWEDLGKAFKIVGNADKKCTKEFHAVGDKVLKINKAASQWRQYELTRERITLQDQLGLATLNTDALLVSIWVSGEISNS